MTPQKHSKLRWTVNRLAAMSAPEVLHRVNERIAKKKGKQIGGWAQFSVPNAARINLNFDETILANLAKVLSPNWQRILDDAQSGSWQYLGICWPGNLGPKVWHLDPVTGKHWPDNTYCFDTSYRHAENIGDVKYVWELNRLQFLVPIAAYSRFKGDKSAASYCLETIESWIDANPPFIGVNWVSGIELALRSISIILTASLLRPEDIPNKMVAKITMALNAHAFWLNRYPSRYSSANNHLIAEALGLYVIGTCLPDLPKANGYKQYGKRVLNEEISKQIHEDGVGAEQSPAYTAFALEMYLTAVAIAKAHGDSFSPQVNQRLQKAAEFLRWITDDGGNQPRFGDDDEGRVIISDAGHEQHYISSVLACTANEIGVNELAPPIRTPHLRELFFGTAAPHKQGPLGMRAFDTGGYSVFRANINGRNVLLLFDHGPLGYLSIAAHGHADALSIWLHVGKYPVIVDAGTFLYHAGRDERSYFRGTSAHNTLTVNETDQSTISGPFNWSKKANAWRLNAPLKDNTDVSVARHDGYKKEFGILHQRSVTKGVGDAFLVVDELIGKAAGTLPCAYFNYFFAPGIEPIIDEENSIRLMQNGDTLACIDVRNMPSQITTPVHIKESPHSPQFGIKNNTNLLQVSWDTISSRTYSVHTKIRIC